MMDPILSVPMPVPMPPPLANLAAATVPLDTVPSTDAPIGPAMVAQPLAVSRPSDLAEVILAVLALTATGAGAWLGPIRLWRRLAVAG